MDLSWWKRPICPYHGEFFSPEEQVLQVFPGINGGIWSCGMSGVGFFWRRCPCTCQTRGCSDSCKLNMDLDQIWFPKKIESIFKKMNKRETCICGLHTSRQTLAHSHLPWLSLYIPLSWSMGYTSKISKLRISVWSFGIEQYHKVLFLLFSIVFPIASTSTGSGCSLPSCLRWWWDHTAWQPFGLPEDWCNWWGTMVRKCPKCLGVFGVIPCPIYIYIYRYIYIY